ncbi:Predicted naringenin-chalcone synthase [Chitinophaga costaii]|uniref:Predicted naringenin-chalcone synthase n=1 Tax=Chitinophaga costaii TaxID=1335309 RepID=A0A1C4E0Z1_9BACT|nr:type III polyketide synthase [Chitinophaga costaii]PUZ24382.1 type III polyketide synthase [Chitinophaga costaii]SCC37268.1 Predicted naringenin-chalcone synthase [Chitinophaga costaii]
MAKIISISTAVPPYQHRQNDIRDFMLKAYGVDEPRQRVLRHLYRHSGIDTRYSVIPDYTAPMDEWTFFPRSENLEPFPMMESRMAAFHTYACPLSLQAAEKCLEGHLPKGEITHLITVSCTGMSAPGLELMLMQAMGLNNTVEHSAINFMGCYAAVHGLKQAAAIVGAQPDAKVLVVCTELCTLHFQKNYHEDAITAPLLFADGSAAVLITDNAYPAPGLQLDSFYAEVCWSGSHAMTWELGAAGFLMSLSGYVPELIRQDFNPMVQRALQKAGYQQQAVQHWCIHPGGARILDAIGSCLSLQENDLAPSRNILKTYGNMSSATLLFVLKEIWETKSQGPGTTIFGAAFGPGLTMESLLMKVV